MSHKLQMLRFRRGVSVDPETCAPKTRPKPPEPTEEQRRRVLEEAALAERCKDGERRQPD